MGEVQQDFEVGTGIKSEPRQLSQYKSLGYGLDDRGSITRMGREFFSSPQRPNRLWVPFSLLSNVYRLLFSGSKAAGAWSWPLISI
jgi:hypothetical protein